MLIAAAGRMGGGREARLHYQGLRCSLHAATPAPARSRGDGFVPTLGSSAHAAGLCSTHCTGCPPCLLRPPSRVTPSVPPPGRADACSTTNIDPPSFTLGRCSGDRARAAARPARVLAARGCAHCNLHTCATPRRAGLLSILHTRLCRSSFPTNLLLPRGFVLILSLLG